MDSHHHHVFFVLIIVIWTLASFADSYRADFIPSMSTGGASMPRQQPVVSTSTQQQGCAWSTLSEDVKNSTSAATTLYPPFLQRPLSPQARGNSYSLDCHLRTLNIDFWENYSFTREQLESTSRLQVRCNDKLYFESRLSPNQSFFRLRNLADVSIHSCKIRKIPARIWESLGFLKSLTISSLNAEWSSAVGMDIEMGAFEGLSTLEKLDLSQNNIWTIPDKNVFCPLRALVRLNMSRNRLSDLEELSFGSTSFRKTSSEESGDSGVPCAMNIQNLDFSYNTLRRINANAFRRLSRVSELRLQNNLIEELDDGSFFGLNQLRLLNLSSNRLVALSPAIFKSSKGIREINLSNNSISALSPELFEGLSNLLSLDLSRNTLTSQWISGNMFHGLSRLVILKLSYNQLTHVDSSVFKDLVNLQALHLDNNQLSTLNPNSFQFCRSIQSLDLSNNRLTQIDARHFGNLFVLRQLYLDHNKIRDMDADALKNCTNLQDLGLASNMLTEVPTALSKAGLRNLVTLDIGENRISVVTNESFAGLVKLYGLRMVDMKLTELPSGFCSQMQELRVLNVAHNKIHKISPKSFTSCPDLRALRLDANLLEELPPTLAPQLPSLLWLNVSQNQLTWADYNLLPQSVEWLDMSHNQIETLLGDPANEGGHSSLRVLDVSHNKLQTLDSSHIPLLLETFRINYNKLRKVSPDTFIRSRLRRVELLGNQLENLPLSALRFPPVPQGKPLPEFYIGGNPFVCDCSMEWLTRVSQLSVLRQHPRIVDLDAIVCRPTFSRSSSTQVIPLVEAQPKDFLCPYTTHCFALCQCCDFDACDCEMSCPSNCTCYHGAAWSSANIVECSNLDYTQVPAKIPMDATEIYLDGNRIPELGNHIFIGKKNLRSLYLNGSMIEVIKNRTFNGLKSLEILRLHDNYLTEIADWTFADLHNLRELYLHNNLLHYISKDAFTSLSSLALLRLDSNGLVNFPVWGLSGNGYLTSVMLSNNPWSCDCEFLIPFRAWVAAKSSIVVDFPLTKCQPVEQQQLFVGSNGTDNFYGDSSNNDRANDHQQQQPQLIINMCDHNKELNFNFNHNNDNFPIPDSELLNSNRISAEKVASNDMNMMPPNPNKINNYHPYNDITVSDQDANREGGGNNGEFWTIFIVCLTLILVAVVIVLFCFFRKSEQSLSSLFSKSATCCSPSSNYDEDETGCGSCHLVPSALYLCCVGDGSKKTASGDSDDDHDKRIDDKLRTSSTLQRGSIKAAKLPNGMSFINVNNRAVLPHNIPMTESHYHQPSEPLSYHHLLQQQQQQPLIALVNCNGPQQHQQGMHTLCHSSWMHHLALSNPSWHSQNLYNNSQHSGHLPSIPGYPVGTPPPPSTTPTVNFGQSFRRHLIQQQSQNNLMRDHHQQQGSINDQHHLHQHHPSNCSNTSQGHPGHHNHHHHHQGSHCSSSHSSSTSNNNPSLHPYQPLDANYSSSSSNEELLDHVYSTLDSPPMSNEVSNPHGVKQINGSIGGCGEISASVPQQNRLSSSSPSNGNSPIHNNNNNANSQSSSNRSSSSVPPNSNSGNGSSNNNGPMYFV